MAASHTHLGHYTPCKGLTASLFRLHKMLPQGSYSGVCLPLTSCNSEKAPRGLHPESQLRALSSPHNSRNHKPSQNWDTHSSWHKVNEIMNNLGGAILILGLSVSIYCCNLFIFHRGCKLLGSEHYLQPCSSDNTSQKSEHIWGSFA